MAVLGFFAGAALGAAQYFLARKAFIGKPRKGLGALYIIQMPILSFGALTLVFFFWRSALLGAAIGMVASMIALAVIFSLKR
jgi:hypothetical protein